MNSRTKNRIALIGFMGSGKSTIGKQLATLMDYKFIDIDERITKSECINIPDIFRIAGESYFRQLESTHLKHAVQEDHCIISCGGGIIESEENIKLLKETSQVVWLRCGLQTMLIRCKGSDRPLLQEENPYDWARQLLEIREGKYATTSHYRIDTDSKSITEISNELYKLILG
ncbi:MAG: shikimate kinase [Bacteroidota bacterium]